MRDLSPFTYPPVRPPFPDVRWLSNRPLAIGGPAFQSLAAGSKQADRRASRGLRCEPSAHSSGSRANSMAWPRTGPDRPCFPGTGCPTVSYACGLDGPGQWTELLLHRFTRRYQTNFMRITTLEPRIGARCDVGVLWEACDGDPKPTRRCEESSLEFWASTIRRGANGGANCDATELGVSELRPCAVEWSGSTTDCADVHRHEGLGTAEIRSCSPCVADPGSSLLCMRLTIDIKYWRGVPVAGYMTGGRRESSTSRFQTLEWIGRRTGSSCEPKRLVLLRKTPTSLLGTRLPNCYRYGGEALQTRIHGTEVYPLISPAEAPRAEARILGSSRARDAHARRKNVERGMPQLASALVSWRVRATSPPGRAGVLISGCLTVNGNWSLHSGSVDSYSHLWVAGLVY